MTTTLARGTVHLAASLTEASAILADLDGAGHALAGGTWIMRGPLRAEEVAERYVALRRIPDVHGSATGELVDLGSLLTHTDVAAIDGGPAFAGVRDAARLSAFPQVRNVATVGGNLAATGFAEADLVPALLAADAQVVLHLGDGLSTESLADYLASRAERPAGEVITRVRVPAPNDRVSAFGRQTLRAAGEYAIANVAVSVDVVNARVRSARVAIGSVETTARLCPASSAALVDRALTGPEAIDAAATAAAAAAADELTPRDGLDAPDWYRLAVLPALFRRALSRLDPGSI